MYEAFKAVKANAGAAGVDKESIEDFEKSLKENLYKVWNRMSSGTYFPPPVKAVAIPKKNGGERILGVPTVADRVAQMVVKMVFEQNVEDISRFYNPVLRGWLEYYGRYCPSAMYPVLRHFNRTLVAWARRKYRRLQRHKTRASLFMERISERQPHLFVHWKRGMVGAFA